MKPLISVVIPNWNGRKFLEICLRSLKKQSLQNFEVLLVDNGSTDDSVPFILQFYPEYSVIREPRNAGWGAASNRGIAASKGEYVLLLNNDLELHPDFMKSISREIEALQEYSMFATRILAFDDRNLIDSLGEEVRHDWTVTKRRHHLQDTPEAHAATEVFAPSATAGLYRRSLFEDVGFFDEDFFIGYDDPDLHFRSRLQGHRCVLVPSAIAYHIGHGTADFQSDTMRYLMTRNYFYYLIKNVPTFFLFQQFFEIIFFHLVWFAKDLFKIVICHQHRHNANIRVRARVDALKSIKGLLKKRAQIQKKRRISLSYLSSFRTG
ncbi:MAG: glycosyltransferase family 2 protein [Patescibacteria group bacterium]|nr:glycosyltransferase family 2 protein [Patescibacteria group bacterium]